MRNIVRPFITEMKPVSIFFSFVGRKALGFIHAFKNIPRIGFIFRVGDNMSKHGAVDLAASISYYSFLALFPLLLGMIALLGFFLGSAAARQDIFSFTATYFPGSAQFIERNIDMIFASRGAIGLISIIGLFWTGSAIFGAFGRVINRAWDIHTQKSFFPRKFRELLMALSTGLLFIISMAATAFPSLVPVFDMPAVETLVVFASRLVGFILLLVVIALLYRFMPDAKTAWRWVWPGAILASALMEIARTLFAIYLNTYATYDIVYGSLEAVIVFLVWIYVSAFIFVIGAEVSSEYHRVNPN
jgi:membrane protein